MNLRDFEYLVAVAETRHFGKAALRCHVSQPTLSMQLKKLEDYLGVTLFERTQKQFLITPIGEVILEKAKHALRAASDMRELAKHAQNPLAGELRLGAFPTLAPYFLPLCIAPIRHDLPQIKLLLVEEKTDLLTLSLLEGRLDCALLALPVEHDALETIKLFEDPFLLAVPKGHALAKRKWITTQDLAEEPLLLLEDGHCLRAQALELCRIANAQEYREFRATSLETLRHMVSAGAGVTLIPTIAMREGDGLCYIPFREKGVARHIGLVFRKSSTRRVLIEKLREIMSQAMQ